MLEKSIVYKIQDSVLSEVSSILQQAGNVFIHAGKAGTTSYLKPTLVRKHECTPTPVGVYENKVIINAHGLKNASNLLVPLVVQRSGTQDRNCLRKSRGSLWELGLLLKWAQGPRPKAKSLSRSLRQLLCSFLSTAVSAEAEGRWKWRPVILVLAWSLPFKWASQTSTVTFLRVDFCWKASEVRGCRDGQAGRRKRGTVVLYGWKEKELLKAEKGAVNEVLGQSVRETVVGHSPVCGRDV